MNNFFNNKFGKNVTEEGRREGEEDQLGFGGSDTVKIVFFLQLYECMMYLKVRIKLFLTSAPPPSKIFLSHQNFVLSFI